ncbi:putative multidrug resistance protein, partial [Aureobasidium melanogenum]
MEDRNAYSLIWTFIWIITIAALFLESLPQRKTQADERVTKEQLASFWSRSFFIYLLPLLQLGYSKIIGISDLPAIDQTLQSTKAYKQLLKNLRRHQGRFRLIRATLSALKWTFAIGILPRLSLTGFSFCQAFLISATLKLVNDRKNSGIHYYEGGTIGAYVLVYFGLATSRSIYRRQTNRFVTMVRACLIVLVYDNALMTDHGDGSDRKAITIMGTDVEQAINGLGDVHEIWACGLEMALAIWLLSKQVKAASIVPVVICILSLVVCGVLSRFLGPAIATWNQKVQTRILGSQATPTGCDPSKAGKIAYCKQDPWIMNKSIRENIVGNLEFDKEWFDTTTSLCELKADLTAFEAGEWHCAGDKGGNLSGGQRQRVALARAVYSRIKIVVLDDPFSGLDLRTMNAILEKLFGSSGWFRRTNTTVVLATHDLNFLAYADEVVSISDGNVVSQRARASGPTKAFDQASAGSMISENAVQSLTVASKEPASTSDRDKPSCETSGVSTNPIPTARRSWSPYKYYLMTIGWPYLTILLVATLVEALASNLSPFWLEHWTGRDDHSDMRSKKLGLFIGTYVLISLLSLLGIAIGCWVFFILIINRSAARLHSDLLRVTLGATFSSFQSQAKGSILNRTSRQIRLLGIEARAPLYNHFLETMTGATTIRAFGWETAFRERHIEALDDSQKPFYMLLSIQQWLTLVLDLLVWMVAVALVATTLLLNRSTSAGSLGVALNIVLTFNTALTGTIQSWTKLETSIGAITRLQAFVETMPQETSGENEKLVINQDWPSQGHVSFMKVTAAHNGSDRIVLRDISFDVKPGEKLAICGTSGSGKSSLIMALLHLLPLQSGKITIDNVNLGSLGVETVRNAMNVLSQEPLTFHGSLRLNLDPNGLEPDQNLIYGLRQVGLWDRFALVGGLDSDMEDRQLSAGETQLISLARAIIRKSKIVVLDEAFSSLDEATEDVVQRVLERTLRAKTVISVTHRFRHISWYDRVVVLDRGMIQEMGSPQELLGRDSKFRALYLSGTTSFERSES